MAFLLYKYFVGIKIESINGQIAKNNASLVFRKVF